MADVGGVSATLISTLLVNKTYFLIFPFIFYFNPYALTIWFGAKNNIEEQFVTNEYKTKKYLDRLKVYLKYQTLVAFSNMLKIYF